MWVAQGDWGCELLKTRRLISCKARLLDVFFTKTLKSPRKIAGGTKPDSFLLELSLKCRCAFLEKWRNLGHPDMNLTDVVKY